MSAVDVRYVELAKRIGRNAAARADYFGHLPSTFEFAAGAGAAAVIGAAGGWFDADEMDDFVEALRDFLATEEEMAS